MQTIANTINNTQWYVILFPDSKFARTIQKQGAQAILGSGPKIWFLEPPENCFETFLVRVPKLLPERFKSIPRKLFLV